MSRARRLCHLHFALAALAAAALFLAACGEQESGDGGTGLSVEHVHGLGINPADSSLFIATHSGLFRVAEGQNEAEPVGELRDDFMGFTVVGPDHFLASGHPAPGTSGPSSVGLIESRDGGESWETVSLSGQADLHVLRAVGERVLGYNSLNGSILLSDDGGRSWQTRKPPAEILDLIPNPGDPEKLIASTARGLAASNDLGKSWDTLGKELGLLAWPKPDALYLVDGDGSVRFSTDGGRGWRRMGSIGGQPAAFHAADAKRLYAALADGTVVESEDGGSSWSVRSRP